MNNDIESLEKINLLCLENKELTEFLKDIYKRHIDKFQEITKYKAKNKFIRFKIKKNFKDPFQINYSDMSIDLNKYYLNDFDTIIEFLAFLSFIGNDYIQNEQIFNLMFLVFFQKKEIKTKLLNKKKISKLENIYPKFKLITGAEPTQIDHYLKAITFKTILTKLLPIIDHNISEIELIQDIYYFFKIKHYDITIGHIRKLFSNRIGKSDMFLKKFAPNFYGLSLFKCVLKFKVDFYKIKEIIKNYLIKIPYLWDIRLFNKVLNFYYVYPDKYQNNHIKKLLDELKPIIIYELYKINNINNKLVFDTKISSTKKIDKIFPFNCEAYFKSNIHKNKQTYITKNFTKKVDKYYQPLTKFKENKFIINPLHFYIFLRERSMSISEHKINSEIKRNIIHKFTKKFYSKKQLEKILKNKNVSKKIKPL